MAERDPFEVMSDPEATEAEKDAAADRVIDEALAAYPHRRY